MRLEQMAAALAPLHLASCLIEQRGERIFEHYRNEQKEAEITRINSCTKSVLSALICIAMDQGLLPEPETPVSAFFPQLLQDADPRKREMRIRHLLTMTSGMDWTEFGGQNSFPQMTRTSNWVDFVLAQPLSEAPGTRMEYNSGNSQLLAAILAQVTGMSVAQYAEQQLFGPLGIADYAWETDPQGIHTGGFGLQLRPADMLKFGRLFLQEGLWEHKPLISKALVASSSAPAIPAAPVPPRRGFYGWHWWVDTYEADANTASPSSPPMDYYNAYGFGGQAIYIIPRLDTVVVLTHDERKKSKIPLLVFRNHIAPMLAAQAILK
ncbi:serine hydrolase [Paenibacillus sp. CGMCC 1.16610]|uniref:Serine hydrolase n=1 Tax=Paenibacillus anseongense TaxID=2682845 RepID=A0ABW9UBF6_9BACL|nr:MULTISPECIES: serine hydrolase [Paenibacillus]MBA2937278.1 serine hydrolase [Paenibacillus sp. CGMCC 1.16610]MVQ36336.1 serine hydrolase [Paenibacillus anseongense]